MKHDIVCLTLNRSIKPAFSQQFYCQQLQK